MLIEPPWNQLLQAQTREFKFERISVEQGLAQVTIYGILQDNHGFMWFGTADGLDRYDGYQFQHYRHDPTDTNSLSHNGISDLAEDPDGALWIGTAGGGLNRLDPERRRFTHYTHDPNDPHSLSSNAVAPLLVDSFGRLWIGTDCGVNVFDKETKRFTHYRQDPENSNSLSNDRVTDIYEDRAGTIWIPASGKLNKFDPLTGTFERYAMALGKLEGVLAVHEDHTGTFWVGGAEKGLLIFDRKLSKVTQRFPHDPHDSTTLLDDRVRVICADATSALWIGSHLGLSRLDRTAGKFQNFRHNPQNTGSINLGPCNRMYRDRSGLLWMETDGSGLNKLDPHPPKFTHLKHEPGNPNSLSKDLPKAICEDRYGDLWIGTVWSGVDRLDRHTGKIKNYRRDPDNPWSLCGDGATAIFVDRAGNLWIASGERGLNLFDRKRERFLHHRNEAGRKLGLPSRAGAAICDDQMGNLWLAEGDSLLKYDVRNHASTGYCHERDNPNSLSSNQINALHEDRQGRLWIGTVNGLNRFDPVTKAFTRYLYDPVGSSSLAQNYVKSIFEDEQGKLWIGTGDGLHHFDPATETITTFHEKDGLPNSFVYGILGDDHGNLWMSTNRGLSRFSPATGKFRNYDLKDGLQSYEFNTGAYHRSKRTGEMFFGGINGVNAFHPDSVEDDSYAPPIALTDFKKLDLQVKLEADIASLDEIKLGYEENVFSFEFAALDFTHPEKNQYAYVLEGFDADWVYCGTRRFARYTNLDPGEYTFRVKGTNHDGVWNEQGASIKVTIVPPFWMTWWFRVAATVVVLSAVAGTARYISARRYRRRLEELERQQALENERKRISKDMHDELGANLTKIAIISDLSQRENDAEKLQSNLQRISETARTTIDSMSEIIWAINPQNNTLDNLSAYLRRCAASLFEMTPVQCHLDFPETVPGHAITAEFRRHLFMVVKEAMHNIVKHSHATKVEMKLLSNDHALEIMIKDNGRGFASEKLNGYGNGLPNMKKRMAEVGGVFEILSQPDEGTEVRILAKIR